MYNFNNFEKGRAENSRRVNNGLFERSLHAHSEPTQTISNEATAFRLSMTTARDETLCIKSALGGGEVELSLFVGGEAPAHIFLNTEQLTQLINMLQLTGAITADDEVIDYD
jgi:hypothetical protein